MMSKATGAVGHMAWVHAAGLARRLVLLTACQLLLLSNLMCVDMQPHAEMTAACPIT